MKYKTIFKVLFHLNKSFFQNEKSKKTILSLFVATLLFSCTETEDVTTPLNEVENLTERYYESNFKSLSNIFIETFEGKKSIEALLESSKLEKSGGEANIDLSVKNTLLNSKAVSNISSNIIAKAKTTKDDFNVETIADFISKNNIEIRAPYLAENFHLAEIDELTLTYYYPGMYGDREDDPHFKGETPGLRYTLDQQGFIIVESAVEVITNDEYALKHPTIVFMPKLDQVLPEEAGNINVNLKKGAPSTENMVVGSPLCSDLTGVNEILTVRMPKLKLRQNFANWPGGNQMFLWVSHGQITLGSNGLPLISTVTANPLVSYHVSRNDANNKAWVSSNLSFLIQNLPYEAKDIHVVWGVSKNSYETNVTQNLTVSNGVITPTYTISQVTKPGVQMITSILYDRCALLYNNRYDINQGFNFFDGYPVYASNEIWTYFKFEKYNY